MSSISYGDEKIRGSAGLSNSDIGTVLISESI